MSRLRAVTIGAIAVAIVGAGAAVVVAGDANTVAGNADRHSTTFDTGASTNSKQWKPALEGNTGIPSTGAETSVTVSAQMTKGKAKFRIVNLDSGQVVAPGAVLFSSKASNSYTFGVEANCPEDQILQWKRAGSDKAVAAKLSVERIYEVDPCI